MQRLRLLSFRSLLVMVPLALASSCAPKESGLRVTVKVRSVALPSSETFWTIMSTLMPASASEPKMLAATPGRSGTRTRVTFASSRE